MDYTEILREHEKRRAEREESCRKECAKIFRTKRISKVVAEFSGSGDSGSIDYREAYDRANEKIQLTREEWDKIEDGLYASMPGGWEINDGSCGKLVMTPDGRIRGQIGWNVVNIEYENIGGGLLPEEEQ